MPPALALRCVLPISRRTVALRQPTGADEMLLLERREPEAGQAIALANALACEGLDAASLPVTDLDVLLLRLRQALIGDRVIAEASCSVPSCGAPVDITFGIATFLAHHKPHRPAQGRWWCGARDDVSGWIELHYGAGAVRFRLPTAGDERDAAEASDGATLLAERCIEPLPCPSAARRAAEAAMAALAPSLAGPLSGTCPNCGTEISTHFDPRRYALAELRARARFVAGDLHTLAARYHWSERTILALPSQRRAAYAEFARSAA